MQGKAAAMIC